MRRGCSKNQWENGVAFSILLPFKQKANKDMTNYYGEHAKQYVSVDCIVFGFEENKLRLLLGKRNMDPGRGELSLYGGFVGEKESLSDAAARVLQDLTGLSKLYMKQVGAFGNIDRDPGERVISIVYCALINVKDYDDQLRIQHGLEWVNLDEMPKLYSDHNIMVDKAITMLRRRVNTEPLSFNLLPNLFTLTQLQHVYEAILGEAIDKRNFRKRIKQIDFIEKTNQIDKITSKRGAALYRFNKRAYEDDPNFKL
jgi:hydrolase, NUDIX family